MRNYKLNLLDITLCVIFPVATILLITWLVAGFTPFYTYQFARNGIAEITGIRAQELQIVISRLAGYVFGTVKDLNHEVHIHGVNRWIYNEKELHHMVDVRGIFDAIRLFLAIYISMGVIYISLVKDRAKKRKIIKSLSQFGLFGTIGIVGALALLVVIDFTKYFIVFHEIFFTNDLWLLDPRTDVLIQMLPEVFFRDIALFILTITLSMQVVFYLAVRRFTKRI